MDTILTILILEKHLDIIYQLWYNPFKYYISKMPEQSVLRLSDAYESKSEEQSRGVKGEHIWVWWRRTYEAGTKGFEEGEKCGEVRIAKLIIELNRQGRMEDIVKMAADSECRKKLLEEFHFD